MQAHCTLQMWHEICGTQVKEDDFVAWLSRLFKENGGFLNQDGQDIDFVPQDTVKLLYEVLHVRETHNIEFQSYLALMQQAGEEMGMMNVLDEEQDDFVALPVLRTFAQNFLKGFSRLMTEIGFEMS